MSPFLSSAVDDSPLTELNMSANSYHSAICQDAANSLPDELMKLFSRTQALAPNVAPCVLVL